MNPTSVSSLSKRLGRGACQVARVAASCVFHTACNAAGCVLWAVCIAIDIYRFLVALPARIKALALWPYRKPEPRTRRPGP